MLHLVATCCSSLHLCQCYSIIIHYISYSILCERQDNVCQDVHIELFPLPASLFFTVKRLIKSKRTTNLSKFTVSALVHLAAVRFLRKNKNVSGMAQETEPELTQKTASKSYSGPDDIEIPFIDADETSNATESAINLDSVVDSEDQSLKGVVRRRVMYSVCDRCLGDIHLGKYFQDNEVQTSSELEKNNERDTSVQCTELEAHSSKSATEVIHSKNEEAILDTLLKHYKCLQVRGIRFTWLGIHQAYRVILVVCNTYITEPLPKLWAMTTALMLTAVANTFMKPYQDEKANKTAILSYAANLCIAMINIGKIFLATFSCKRNCSVVDTLLWYFSLCEKILLIYLPLVAFVVWVIYVGIQKSRSKDKSE